MLLTCCNAQNELHVTKPVCKAEHASYWRVPGWRRVTPAWSLTVLIHCGGALAVSPEISCIPQHQAFRVQCMQVTWPAPEVRPHTPQRGRSARSALPCVTLQCCA